ncbi:MAG: ParB/RepB/Spo0J family partition protein [Alphaproteobacteria bacterium]|nr:ParB/RepB/Spo0J family partition protein [Alphaproteobacteria bacterium]
MSPADVEHKKRNLGRGLSSLLGDDEPAADLGELDKLRSSKNVPVEFLRPGKFQPRHNFDDDKFQELVESVRAKGILQPILVRRHPDERNSFEIIAGERRWRAAQMAKLHDVPVIVREFSDKEALEVALVENLQRQDLSAIEEAEGYKRLMEEFRHTQEDLAKVVGKSRSHVANTLRLLTLPALVRTLVEEGTLSAGHARALLGAPNAEELAEKVVAKGLSVRQTEKLAQAEGGKPVRAGSASATAKGTGEEHDADTLALERDLSNLLGLKVNIKFRGDGGELVIHYKSLEQLDDVLHRLSSPKEERRPGKGEEESLDFAGNVDQQVAETDLLAGEGEEILELGDLILPDEEQANGAGERRA